MKSTKELSAVKFVPVLALFASAALLVSGVSACTPIPSEQEGAVVPTREAGFAPASPSVISDDLTQSLPSEKEVPSPLPSKRDRVLCPPSGATVKPMPHYLPKKGEKRDEGPKPMPHYLPKKGEKRDEGPKPMPLPLVPSSPDNPQCEESK